MIFINEIEAYLNKIFKIHLYPQEANGIWIHSDKPISKIGIALEPWDGIEKWVRKENLDVLFLHRPWLLQKIQMTLSMGIIAYHLPFDELLTIGYNPYLATDINLERIKTFGEKEGRPLGMTGYINTQTGIYFCEQLKKHFNGLEAVLQITDEPITKVAFVGAMNIKLINTAIEDNIQLYITGQLREKAVKVLKDNNIGLIAVGHKRSEIYGLILLTRILTQKWPTLHVIINL